jgi:hypothetical protein
MVAAIVELLGSPCFHPAEAAEHYLVPTYDLRAPGFDPRRYWRGPVWINTDWLLWLGLRQHGADDLADEQRAGMLGLVESPGSASTSTPSAARATAPAGSPGPPRWSSTCSTATAAGRRPRHVVALAPAEEAASGLQYGSRTRSLS